MAELVKHTVVNAGLRVLAKGGLGVCLYRVVDGRLNEGTEHVFAAKKGARHLMVGGTYEVEGNEELTSCVLNSFTWKARFTDAGKVAAWKAAEEAAEVSDRVRRDEQAAKRHDALVTLLAPIRREYVKTDSLGRAAIEAMVLRALRRPASGGDI